jgi:hypothetical protein
MVQAMTPRPILLLLAALLFAPALSAAPGPPKTAEDYRKSEEFRIGTMVKQIQAALNAPERPQSLEIIVKYGQDTRYYMMIRGWLIGELQAVESQLPGTRDAKRKRHFLAKRKLLKTAVRRIDME